MAGEGIIETGVDKLLKLVAEKGRISFEDAARRLEVSTSLIGEWADFLEEEGALRIEYKFTVPYMVKLELTQKELKEKIKKIGSDKEIFGRKAESLVLFLEDQGASIQEMREGFEKLKQEMSQGIKEISIDLKKFEEYREFKEKIDLQIKKEKEELGNKIGEFNSDILKESQTYQVLSKNLKNVHIKVLSEYSKLESLKKEDELIRRRVDMLNETMGGIAKKISKKEFNLETRKKELNNLKNRIEESIKHISKKRTGLNMLIKSSKKEEKNLLKLQNDLIRKAMQTKKEFGGELSEGEVATKKFENFIKKRVDIYNDLDKVEKQREELLKYVKKLLIQAKNINLVSKSPELTGHIKELETKFNEVDEKKELFKGRLKKLAKLIRGR